MSLIKDKPTDPIQFLIDRLQTPESKLQNESLTIPLEKRIVIVTPPGMKGGIDAMSEEQYNVGLMLNEHLKEL